MPFNTFFSLKKLAVVLALVLVPLASVSAATFESGEQVFLGGQLPILDDIYAAGDSVVTQSEIEGDFIGAGRTITISKAVSQDVIAAGQTVTISAPVGDDVRAAGQTVSINEAVGDDVIVAGADLIISSDVGGDVAAGGANVSINGDVGGSVKAGGELLVIAGTVEGDVEADVQKLVIKEGGAILGNLSIASTAQIEGMSKGVVVGETTKTISKHAEKKDRDRSFFKKLFGFWILFKFLTMLAVALVIGLGFKKLTHKIYKGVAKKKGFWSQVGKGLLMLIGMPVIAVLLFVFGITWPLGMLVLLSWAGLLIIGLAMTTVTLGGLIHSWIAKKRDAESTYDGEPSWKSILVGVIAMMILMLIPLLGSLAILVLFCAVLGALHDIKKAAYKKL